ncbi:Taste receptor type 2 member 9, partial [Calypte anna]
NVTTYNAVAMAIITLQTFAGMWINAFIVSVLCVAWGKKRSFNSNEKILLFLGCSRSCYLFTTWVFSFFENIYPLCMYVYSVYLFLVPLQDFFNVSNVCVSAFLSVFYCIKIANFQHSFFIYLKVRIDRMMPWLMLASVLISLGYSIFVYKIVDESICDNVNCTMLGHIWKYSIRIDQLFSMYVLITGFVFAIAFSAVSFSVLLLLFSLWRHKHKMQTESGKNVSVDAHIKAMKSILSFFFTYTINFVCLVLTLTYPMKNQKAAKFLIFFFQHSFPAVHSLILIFSNPKLEKTLLRTL